jgi:hypothetical protein
MALFNFCFSDNGTRIIQSYTFDFYNYAGIHRPVYLYTTPSIYIDDISVHTGIRGDTGEQYIWNKPCCVAVTLDLYSRGTGLKSQLN